jgi:hypothetical protein
MEQQNMDQLNPSDVIKKRPAFLTVLCILSFVGIGIGFISALYSIFTFSRSVELMNQYGDMMSSSPFGGMMDSLVKWGQTLYIIQLIANLICLAGVLMMWNLKRMGYFIYVIGEIAPAIASFALIGGYGPLGTFAMMIGLIFPIAFIIMYGLNLKQMS